MKKVFRLRECGSEDRLGIRILPSKLETMLGGGHSWEAVNFHVLGESEHGSRVYSQPGQMVVEVGGARRTLEVVGLDKWSSCPYIKIEVLNY